MKIKKGDNVKVIAGKDRGKRGKVLSVFPSTGKVVVEGVNALKKNVRPKKEGEKGQVVEFNAAFPASRVMLICSKCGKAARVGFKRLGKKKARICKKCKAEF